MPPVTRETGQAADIVRRIKRLLPRARLRDRAAAGRRLNELRRKSAGGQRLLDQLSAIEKQLEQSAREVESRRQRKPRLYFPAALPIMAKRSEIVRSIRTNPVTIVWGETGCGKSTQIPKMCLEAGRGIAGQIACTQPRRIAAITIAHRIAEELGERLGRSVGYKIRFQDKTPPDAYIKIMTDGMLLAETQSDRRLYAYDTLIIDEAHERSLNIDFLLGIARTLLTVRPELRVVITSATLDTEKFVGAFDGAPVIEAGGRLYPVEVEYLPPESFSPEVEESDYVDMAVRAVDRLKSRRHHGDILIFMPTEQDILETCERLAGKAYSATTILPLYARLPAAQQGRVYSVTGPKIVVATNVAETSLTIPGIKYVIDTGLARIAQYQPGTRINSLPISPISQASAEQRKGRCGRVQEGHCIRLYSQDDYESRPPFTPPEIVRSNLAEVILRMIDLKLGRPSEFPFVDRPQPKNIKDGYDTLYEIGAIAARGGEDELTPLGRRMARLPLDPRISRMLLEAEEEGCLREIVVIASALSIRDPRERPPDKAALADQAQSVFVHPDSDFLTYLNLWERFIESEAAPKSASRRKKFCHEHFLSYVRMREWIFVHEQLVSILREQKIRLGRERKAEMTPELYAGIHRSVLSGFLSNIAVHKEKNFYQAAKGREAMVFPGSVLFNKSRPWIVAAEMVRTSRLFARTAARIDPAWLEELGGSLCRYSYSAPRWDESHGEVRAKERVTLFGLEIISDRDVPYGPKNPEEAHKIFVAEALVEGRIENPPDFLRHNLDLQKKILSMEDKLRRRDIMVSEDVIADFYSRRLAGVYDLRSLKKRIRQAGGDESFLRMAERDLLFSPPEESELSNFPDEIAVGASAFPAAYKFAPGDDDDGVTVRVPYGQISGVPSEVLEWGVPGHFKDKIGALVKGLPKSYRKQLMPFSETVEIIVKEMKQTGLPLADTLAGFVKKRFHADVPAAEWARAEIPGHLRMRVAVIDPEGRELAASRNLDMLRRAGSIPFDPADTPDWKKARAQWEKDGLTDWNIGPLPESVPAGPFLTAYPGLEPSVKGVNIRLFRSREDALASHVRGVEALLRSKFSKDVDFLKRYLVVFEEYEKAALYFGGKEALEKGLMDNITKEIFRKDLRSQEEFDAYSETVVKSFYEKSHALREATFRILESYQQTRRAVQDVEQAHRSNRAVSALCQEIREETEVLVPKNFLEIYSLGRLVHLPRYLAALRVRLNRGKDDPEKDRKKAESVSPFSEALQRLKDDLADEASLEKRSAVQELRWMVEEFKLAVFAPEVRTAFPISPKRLAVKIKEIEGLMI
jgi:ATP-dependent helicase HrpA